jgi:hypothetical protein
VFGGDRDRLIEVGTIDHHDAADEVLGLGERPIADERFALA